MVGRSPLPIALSNPTSHNEGHLLGCAEVRGVEQGWFHLGQGQPVRSLSPVQGSQPCSALPASVSRSLPCLVQPSCHPSELATVERRWPPTPALAGDPMSLAWSPRVLVSLPRPALSHLPAHRGQRLHPRALPRMERPLLHLPKPPRPALSLSLTPPLCPRSLQPLLWAPCSP